MAAVPDTVAHLLKSAAHREQERDEDGRVTNLNHCVGVAAILENLVVRVAQGVDGEGRQILRRALRRFGVWLREICSSRGCWIMM